MELVGLAWMMAVVFLAYGLAILLLAVSIRQDRARARAWAEAIAEPAKVSSGA